MAVAFALAIIAFLYASVGHGGATGYIAIFALANYSATLIKPLALILNIAVASVGCWNFLRAGHFPEPKFAALYGLSIPAAFIGGSLNLPGLWFEKIVGVILLLSGLCLVEKPKDPINLQHVQVPLLFLAGGLLGLLAGFTGTGVAYFLRHYYCLPVGAIPAEQQRYQFYLFCLTPWLALPVCCFQSQLRPLSCCVDPCFCGFQ